MPSNPVIYQVDIAPEKLTFQCCTPVLIKSHEALLCVPVAPLNCCFLFCLLGTPLLVRRSSDPALGPPVDFHPSASHPSDHSLKHVVAVGIM